MELNNIELIEGREYIFDHKRKGVFKAIFQKIVEADKDDEQDGYFLECAIDTSPTGTPRLAKAANAMVTISNLRPSLLRSVREAPKYQPPATQLVTEPPTKQTRLRTFLKRLGGK